MDDPLPSRYAAIVRRVHALLDEPSLQRTADAPTQANDETLGLLADDETLALLSDAVYRLALHEPAMPGARLAGLPGKLAELERALDSIAGHRSAVDDLDDLDEHTAAPG